MFYYCCNKNKKDGGGLMNPVTEYKELSKAFDCYNKKFFAGVVPAAIITLRGAKSINGFFRFQSFAGRNGSSGEKIDEIALNPENFLRPEREVLSTLVHEMCHSWQFHFSKKCKRNSYHDNEWAEMMQNIGLVPSGTGQPGGKTTGQRMTHYIQEGGKFALYTAELLGSGWRLNYSRERDPEEVAGKKRATKTKYTCPECGVNAWGKLGINIVCGNCDQAMEF
jgi:predicted SprT family Zn-dependent metalloprotease